jgi:hypothetical protein
MKNQRLALCLALLSLTITAGSGHAAKTVPFRAVYNLEISAQITPPLATVSAEGTGLATQLGVIEVASIEEMVNLATGEGLAQYRYTAANGDAIEVEIQFNVVPTATGFTSSGTWHVINGTGRFLGATGTGRIVGQIEFAGVGVGVAHLELNGTMTTPRQTAAP